MGGINIPQTGKKNNPSSEMILDEDYPSSKIILDENNTSSETTQDENKPSHCM